MDYKTIYEEAKQFGETNDCAVKAAAIATGTEYARVHRLFAIQGRKNGCGSQQHWTPAVLEHLGYEMENITAMARRCGAKTVRTAERVLGAGTFLVRVSGHILCIKDGEVQDWTAGRQHRVKAVYRVSKVGEEAPMISEPSVVRVTVNPEVKTGKAVPMGKRSVKSQIHGIANEMWNAAGRPTDVAVLRKLRKTMMDVLEQQGVKRTSASTELGQWQKGVL